MIIGIGSDILDIRRLEKVCKKHPEQLAKKILSEQEFLQWQTLPKNKSVNFLAKRWSAKEAFAKACGTGIRTPVLWKNITLSKDKLGKPLIETHNELTKWLNKRQAKQIHISLSDDKPYCVAFVIIER